MSIASRRVIEVDRVKRVYNYFHGRRPRATGGRSPQKNFRWGDGSCIRPPNILRSSVCRMPAKAPTE